MDGDVETNDDGQLEATSSDSGAFPPFHLKPQAYHNRLCNVAGPPITQRDNRLTAPHRSHP